MLICNMTNQEKQNIIGEIQKRQAATIDLAVSLQHAAQAIVNLGQDAAFINIVTAIIPVEEKKAEEKKEGE